MLASLGSSGCLDGLDMSIMHSARQTSLCVSARISAALGTISEGGGLNLFSKSWHGGRSCFAGGTS